MLYEAATDGELCSCLYLSLPFSLSLSKEWIQQNHILSIVLRDSLHQPQYVEKLEKILRFVIKEKALTMQDLDSIWAAQVRTHLPRDTFPPSPPHPAVKSSPSTNDFLSVFDPKVCLSVF